MTTLYKTVDANARFINEFIEEQVEHLLIISDNWHFRQSIISGQPHQRTPCALESMLEINSDDMSAITTIGVDGTVLDVHPATPDLIGQDLSKDPGFQYCYSTGTPHISGVTEISNGQFGIIISVPIIDDQQFVGLIRWTVNSKTFLDKILDTELLNYPENISIVEYESHQKSWLMESNGNVIAHPVNYHVGENYLDIHRRNYPDRDWAELEKIMNQIQNRKSGFAYFQYHDSPETHSKAHNKLIVYHIFSVYNQTWASCASINYDYLDATMNAESRRIYSAAIAIIVLLLTFGKGFLNAQKERIIDQAKIDNLQAVAESNKRFQELSQLLPQSVFESDIHGNFTYSNQHGLTALGYSQKDIDDGLSIFDVIVEDQRELARVNFTKTLRGEDTRTREYDLLRRDGSSFPVLLSTSMISQLNNGGGIRGIAINISGQKKIEKELELRSQISDAFHTSMGEEVYSNVLAIILKTFSSPFGSFGFIDENGDLVLPSLTLDVLEEEHRPDQIPVFPIKGNSIFARAIRNKRGEYVNKQFKMPFGHLPIHRAIDVPVNYNGKIIGNFLLGNKADDYTDEDLHLLEIIAEQVAPILNAKLALDTNYAALEYLAVNLSSVFGENLIENSALKLCSYLKADYVMIGRLKDNNTIETIALTEGEKLAKNFVYELSGTPSNEIVTKGVLTYLSNISEIFPEDHLLLEREIEGYIGVPLFDSQHQLIGILVAMYKTELETAANAESIMQLYSVRLAAEIERFEVDEVLQFTSQKLIQEKERTDSILEGTNAGTWVWNVQTGELAINDRWAEIMGYIPEELEPIDHNTWVNNIHPDDLVVAEEMLEKLFIKERNYYDCDFRQPHKDGSWIWVNSRGNVTEWGSNGEPLVMSGTHIDITKQKMAEQEKLIFERKLHQSQKLEAIGTMVGGISHELNNVLQSMFLYGGIIKEKLPDDQDLLENFQHLIRDGERARDIVKQILTFSRNTNVDLKPRIINNLITEAITFERASLPANIKIEQDINIEDCMVLCDRTQIHQIILNLCNNSQYAMEESGGTLTVSLQKIRASLSEEDFETDHVILEVSDNGHGMSAEILEKIFDPFFTTKEIGAGTGLGLSVVHGIVETMGWTISATSDLGEGTTVKIQLPIVGKKEEEKAIDKPEESAQESNRSILLVDDQDSIRELTQKILTGKGFKVDSASDGEQALDQFKSNPDKYDLIITDLSMPKLSGTELTQKIRDMNSDVIIILSTGQLGVEDKKEYGDIGVNGFIQKPWAVEELLKLIDKINN